MRPFSSWSDTVRTIFAMGFRPPMGQFEWGTLISSLITAGAKAGIEYYTSEKQIKEIKKQREFQEAQAAAAQKKAETEKKAAEAALNPPPSTAAAGKIIGIDSTTFYVGAGVLGVGALIATIIATR